VTHEASARVTPLTTSDGEVLHATIRGSGADWVVLAHGFSVSSSAAPLARVADRLATRHTVLAYDARGHGRSTGVTTLGDREVLDVDAAVAHARSQGAERVVTLGFSMGGVTVLRHAGRVDGYGLAHPPDAVVAVSSSGPWSTRGTASRSMRRIHFLVETRPGRWLARRVLRTRVDPRGWQGAPVAPVDAVAGVEVPLLVVHGDRDGYFGPEHPAALAGAGALVWLEEGFGHAETAIAPELVDRIADHVRSVLA